MSAGTDASPPVPRAEPHRFAGWSSHNADHHLWRHWLPGPSHCERLACEGATVRIAVRQPDRVDTLTKSIGSGRTIPVAADVRDPSTVAAAIAGSESVVNAVSAYVEKSGVTYTAVHVHGAGNIGTACQQRSVARLVHISGIGANPASRSKYIRARGLGELAAQKAFPPATVLRPSVMFAVNEGLLGVLEKLAQSTPIIPLIEVAVRGCSLSM
jgi:NADH dehydrogenase